MATRSESPAWFLGTGSQPRPADRPTLLGRLLRVLRFIGELHDEVRALQRRFPAARFPMD